MPSPVYQYVINLVNKTLYPSKLDLNLRKKLVKCDTWSTAVYAETQTLWKVEQKYLESFEMWC